MDFIELTHDPLIEIYINLTKNSLEAGEMPIFSETLLRFAFRQHFGKYRCVNSDELKMYRKLLLYYYADEYTDVDTIAQIMNCFSHEEINEILEDCDVVMDEWKSFVNNKLLPEALTQTFKFLLTEWSKRYTVVHGAVNMAALNSKALEFQNLLDCTDCVSKTLQKMRNKLIKPTMDAQSLKAKWTVKDLSSRKIIEDLLLKINPLLRFKLRAIQWPQTAAEVQVKEEEQPTAAESIKRPRLDASVSEDTEDLIKIVFVDHKSEGNSQTSDEEISFQLLSTDEDVDDDKVTVLQVKKEGTEETSNSEKDAAFVTEIIDLQTAKTYATEVHAFALVNGYQDIGDLMQRVTILLNLKDESSY